VIRIIVRPLQVLCFFRRSLNFVKLEKNINGCVILILSKIYNCCHRNYLIELNMKYDVGIVYWAIGIQSTYQKNVLINDME